MQHTWDESLVRHRFAELGDVRLHYVEAGNGPLVVLLHGFPEFWYSWRNQIPALVAAGFRVVAPDLRGYNLSDKPKGVEAYESHKLTDDVAKLIRSLGEEKAIVIGHDWGGAVAWMFALRHPSMVVRLAVLNCPHPRRLFRAFLDLRQLRRSWYMFFFQIPGLPERLLSRRNYRGIGESMRSECIRKDAVTREDVERYAEAFRQPGALTGAINYYRAMFRSNLRESLREMRTVIRTPVLVLWGMQDKHLMSELAEPERAFVPDARVVRIPNASHWVQVDAAETVNEELVRYCTEVREELTRSGRTRFGRSLN